MALRDVLNRYFRTKDGIYHPEHQVKTAYYLISGKKASEDLEGYHSFVESIMDKTVTGCFQIEEIEITAELFETQKALCCVIYRDVHGCGLGEAKRILEARFKNGGRKA